tara:strand:- start:8 stop:1624 length:1617 start_codon:yes stop_codon:yes gene_type:complete
MIYLKQIKKTGIIVILAVLAACSTTTPTVKNTSVDKDISTTTRQGTVTKQKVAGSKSWFRSYGKRQEAQPNIVSTTDDGLESDVWLRIRSGFTMTHASPLNQPTQKQLDRFLGNRQYLKTVTERARPYLHYIVSELDKRNMPMEIALLPVVESGFKPYVYSNSGAAGLWQFMPATGKVFGLEQNGWYDGRRDIVASTDAALDYLQKLHGDFDDWELAIAAYNAGEGTVGRAIKKNQEAGKDIDFWSLDLPSETTEYIPKLLAISHLVFEPNRYGLSLRPIENKPVFTVVDIGSQIDLALAAKLAGVSSDELYRFNPGLNYWATQPEGPHELVIPVERVDHFKRKLAALPDQDRMQWQRHQIKQGESLGGIAKKYHTTVAALKKTNKLSSNNIRAGSHLMIPASMEKVGNLANQSPMPKQQQASRSGPGKKITHVVKKGDTWWDLALTYKVDVGELAKWNGKSAKDTISLGQKLTVWVNQGVNASAVMKTVSYRIKSGDSLWKISKQFNVSVAQVREWNGLSNRTLLKPGQTLTLYVDV